VITSFRLVVSNVAVKETVVREQHDNLKDERLVAPHGTPRQVVHDGRPLEEKTALHVQSDVSSSTFNRRREKKKGISKKIGRKKKKKQMLSA
jgi:hypothetical protein